MQVISHDGPILIIPDAIAEACSLMKEARATEIWTTVEGKKINS